MKLSTPDLCDQYAPELQIAEPCFRHYGLKRSFGGQVVTVKCLEDNSRVAEQVRLPGMQRVLVVDGGGSLRCSLLGDMLAEHAQNNGWQGIVVNGCVRDVEILAGLNVGILALAAYPRKTEKAGRGEVDVPVSFAGLDINPGDFLYADQSGVIVSSRNLLA